MQVDRYGVSTTQGFLDETIGKRRHRDALCLGGMVEPAYQIQPQLGGVMPFGEHWILRLVVMVEYPAANFGRGQDHGQLRPQSI